MSRTRDLLLVWCAASTTFLLGMLVASCEPTRDLTAVEAPQEQPSAETLVSGDSANVLGVGSDELLYVAPGAGERGPQGEKGEQGEPGPEGPQGSPGIGLGVRIRSIGFGFPGQESEIEFPDVELPDVLLFQCHTEDSDSRWTPVPCEAKQGWTSENFVIEVDLSDYQDPGGEVGTVRAVLVGTFD